VAVPPKLQLAGRVTRSDDDEKRKKRTTNFCDSAASRGDGRAVQLLLHERAARLAVAIGDRHAARVVDEDAEEVLLRHRRLEDQRRPEQADQEDATTASRSATSTARSIRLSVGDTPR
jgi:hypothetical protein